MMGLNLSKTFLQSVDGQHLWVDLSPLYLFVSQERSLLS